MPFSAADFLEFQNAETMIRALADEIVSRLYEGVASRGAASLVVSGGTTPGALFDELSARAAPWDRVWITLADERWIAPDQDGSNEKLVRTRLLTGMAAGANLVALKTADASPKAAEARVNALVAAIPQPFDFMLLGMGDDGHTASLFPHAAGLETALDTKRPNLVQAIHADAAAATGERLSLTLRAILDSRLIAILIRGDAKLAAYRKAAAGTDVLEAPVRALLNQSETPVRVYWSP
jgi:6-phosphogluconolactonase